MTRLVTGAVAIALSWLLAGCELVARAPEVESAARVPQEFTSGEGVGNYAPRQWWHTFEDPVLDRVIETVLAANFELAEAVARLEQARARARITGAARFPMARALGEVSGFDAPANAGLGAQLDELGLGNEVTETFGVVLPERLDLTTYTLAAEFAYELDFWGRNRHSALAGESEFLAREADYRAAVIGVLAESISTYLGIVNLRRQQALAEEMITIFKEQAELARQRYEHGVLDVRALYEAQRKLRNGQAELPGIEARLADAEGRLWTLLGGYREDLVLLLPDALDPISALTPVPAGIPADLLAQRPDVGAARQRLAAARHAVGAKRAQRLPSLSLKGAIGLQSTAAGDWFDADQWFRNLGANLVAPVFQGGRLRAEVALAEARFDEAAAAFGRSVLTAVNEVEAALAALAANRRRVARLLEFADETAAEAALREARYVAGVGDYAVYLAASQSLVAAQSALAGAERDLGLARLTLHRALGGAWAAPEEAGDAESLAVSSIETRNRE